MPNVRVFEDRETLSQGLVDHILQLTETADDPLKVALSGGSTPKRAYELLAASEVDRAKIKLFMVDERYVPPTDDRSNQRMIVETFFPVAPCAEPGSFEFHAMYREGGAEAAAKAYDLLLEREVDRFDLVLLGLGEDGHTASIFPGLWPQFPEGARCVAAKAPVVAEDRITLTPGPLCTAKETIFVVSGREKAKIFARVLHGVEDFENLPAQYVARKGENVQWWVDRQAAN